MSPVAASLSAPGEAQLLDRLPVVEGDNEASLDYSKQAHASSSIDPSPLPATNISGKRFSLLDGDYEAHTFDYTLRLAAMASVG
jgi:hypothetical protein